MTILSIAQRCAERLQITNPATFVGSSNNNYILLLAMIRRAIDEISNEFEWPELTSFYEFKLINGQTNYLLPYDFDRRINETLWNKDQHWPLIGPVTAQVWEQYINGFITTLPRQRFRVVGASDNQFYINPTPDGLDGQRIVYEYINRSKVRPVAWAANTAYTTSSYVWFNGLILKGAVNGTSNADAGQPPVYGIDNTTRWDPIPDYVASQVYYKEQLVYANSKVYKVTTSGLSSASSPSVTSGSETLGTAVFEYQATPSAWAGGTSYSDGDYAVANSHALKCIQDGTSGRLAPKFYAVYGAVTTSTGQLAPPTITKKIADGAGTLVWDVYENEYTISADTDEVKINEQIIIDGACWRFLQARGFEYAEDKRIADIQKEAIKANKIGASTVAMNYQAYAWPWAIGWWSYPSGDYNPPS